MRRPELFILTSHDLDEVPNSRLIHLANYFGKRWSTTVIFRKQAFGRGEPFSQRLRTFFRLEVSRFTRGGVFYWRLNPWGARPYGLGTRLLGLKNPFLERPSPGKRLFQEFLGAVGGISDFLVVPSLLYLFSRFKPSPRRVVVAQGPYEGLCAAVLRKRGLFARFIYDDADYEPGFAPTGARRRFIRIVERLVMKKADQVVCVGELLAARRCKDYGLQRVEVIPNGVSYELFSPAQEKTGQALIYTGYIGGWSGLELLFAALSLLQKRGLALELILAGHQEEVYFRNLKELGQRLGIRYLYLGKVPYQRLPVVLKRAVCGWALFPPIELRRYAFSLKVVEYMAAGCAVVSTADTESGLTVRRAGAGLVLPYQAEAVAEGLFKLFTERALLEGCRQKAALAAREYDWAKLLKKYESLLILKA